jgi:cell division protein YceG involved in septum cleavage
MKNIITALQFGKPDEQLAGVPDGLRLTQYPPYFTILPNFNATTFASIVKTGILPDGTQLWKKYWFVQQPPSPKAKVKVFDALEGYLYPDHYYFNNSDDTVAVIEKMLLELGSQFCPGPAGSPDQYVDTLADCKQHAAMIGNTSIFTSMESAYHTKNDTLAIYDTLTIASLTAREISHYNDAIGVASVYHNRYLDSINAIPDTSGTAGYMGSDPSAEYARDSDTPPKDGKWWTTLADQGKNIDPNNPYNTDANTGLPPGPIANPVWTEIEAAAGPKSPTAWPYFYFVSDKCGKIYYGKDLNDFNTNVVPKENTGNC